MILSQSEIDEYRKMGIVVLRKGDREYPARLMNLAQPPDALFCRGNIELLTRPSVSIVGTRECTRYGMDVAQRFARAFVESGLVVVSGLADGIDTNAHLGAGARNTIAVLGNGLNVYFPTNNRKLQDEIGREGLLISEYPPSMGGGKYTYPQRNRIVAGLSPALLIVEADEKSGTMITKDFAKSLGADVFAIPGSVTSPASRGTNKLIKDGGCLIATEPADVLAVYGKRAKGQKTAQKAVVVPVVQISFDEKRVLDILGRDEVHIDELVEKIDMPFKKLSALLTEMEMRGLVEKLAGNCYVAKG